MKFIWKPKRQKNKREVKFIFRFDSTPHEEDSGVIELVYEYFVEG